MKTWIIVMVSLFIYCPGLLFGQWHDDFSDGDFTNTPAWQGDVNKFIVDNGWLRLNDTQAGTSYLAVESDIATNASWEFVFKINFNPSSTNYAKVYLMTDQSDLKAPLNGYFLRLGHTDDDICLFRQNGTKEEKLISSRAKILDVSSSHVRVLVTRDSQSHWTLKTDLSGGRDYILEGSASDNQIKASSWFGVVCIYTITRATGFFFDDFYVDGEPYTDRDPPVVTSFSAKEKQAQIQFSEAITPISPPYSQFFKINDAVYPMDLARSTNSSINISFTDDLKCGINHQLSISGLSDLNGNAMRDTILYFSLPCLAGPYDIVINEIMANPSPLVRLPEYEYIELYNRSDKNIQLKNWTFTYGNTSKTFPDYLFPAESYVLLTHPEAEASLSTYGVVIPLLGSKTAIANNGQYLELKDHTGNVISWVDFTTDWYQDPHKANGGWSLEQINPDLTCSLSTNWKASSNVNGGTPGKQNSVFATTKDSEYPEICKIGACDTSITLFLSKSAGMPLPSLSQIKIQPEVPIKNIRISGRHFDQLEISTNLQPGQWYDISIEGTVLDCSGYEARSGTFRIALPQIADSSDVIINEILFNPFPDGYTFVELFNRSNKTILVSDLSIALRTNGKLSTPVSLTDDLFLLLPQSYLAISRNINDVISRYEVTDRKPFLQTSIPSLGKESGQIVLLDKSMRVLDEVHYNSKQHVDFLKISNGVSLERLHPDRNSLDPGNWHTAAQTVGYGTPGRKNSQYIPLEEIPTEVTLNHDVFSPNNDGLNDVLLIQYQFNTPSLMADVIIFDSSGRKVKQIAHQELLATQGSFSWDGSNDKGYKSLTGLYIVFFQAYNSTGFMKTYKILCILAKN